MLVRLTHSGTIKRRAGKDEGSNYKHNGGLTPLDWDKTLIDLLGFWQLKRGADRGADETSVTASEICSGRWFLCLSENSFLILLRSNDVNQEASAQLRDWHSGYLPNLRR
jgi:hypothetical protein